LVLWRHGKEAVFLPVYWFELLVGDAQVPRKDVRWLTAITVAG